MLKLILLFVIGVVACGQALHQTSNIPGVLPVETLLHRRQGITSLTDLATDLGLDSPFGLRIERSRRVSTGLTRQRIRLTYDGLDIRGYSIQATVDRKGRYNGAVSGYLPRIQSLDTSVNRGDNELRQALADYASSLNDRPDIGDIKADDIDKFESVKQIHIDQSTGEPRTIYFVRGLVELDRYIRYPRAIVEASSLNVLDGSVALRYRSSLWWGRGSDNSCPSGLGGNTKSPGPYYGPARNQVCLNAKAVGDTCYLANDRIVVRSLNNQNNRRQAEIVSFPCASGPSDVINGANSPNADSYYYSQIFLDMINDWGDTDLGRDMPITLYTHFGESFVNSFFDGYHITFGDGGEEMYPFAVSDVIGHELAHQLTDDFGNLLFDDESRVLDESFGDLVGKALSVYAAGSDKVSNWGFATNLLKENGKSLRYFDDPTKDGWSITNVKEFDEIDNLFKAGGIFNKAFYCMVGQRGTPLQSAFRAFVHANAIYWHEETGFIDGACGVYRAFSDYGLDVDVADKCFNDVGIDLSFCSLSGTARDDE